MSQRTPNRCNNRSILHILSGEVLVAASIDQVLLDLLICLAHECFTLALLEPLLMRLNVDLAVLLK